MILSERVQQLVALDRYERRALSRRNTAIRAFESAQRPTPESPIKVADGI